MRTHIITDSACDLPAQIIADYQIEVFPFTILLNNQEYLDGVTITTEQLYQFMRAGHSPKTSQVNPQLMRDSFLQHAAKGESCIYIAFSAALSGTYQTSLLVAREVKALYPDFDIEIIDSKGGSLATGLVVYQAARMAKNGVAKAEIVRFIKNQSPHIEHIFTVDNLESLYRGGRLSRSGAIIGNILNIKPVLHVVDGSIQLLEKVRGKKKAIEKIVEVMEEKCLKVKDQIIGIAHADDLENALNLKAIIQERLGFNRFMVNLIGSVLGAHIGIGGVGLFFPNQIFYTPEP